MQLRELLSVQFASLHHHVSGEPIATIVELLFVLNRHADGVSVILFHGLFDLQAKEITLALCVYVVDRVPLHGLGLEHGPERL